MSDYVSTFFWVIEPFFFGSSGNSGERGSDLQEEVFVVPESISHALDHFDAVVDAFQKPRVQWPGTVVEYAMQITYEPACKQHQRLDPTLYGPAIPLLPEESRFFNASDAPQRL